MEQSSWSASSIRSWPIPPTSLLGKLPPSKTQSAQWVAKGCYQDSIYTRMLGFRYDVDGNNDAEACTAQCHNKGYLYAGLEYGTECWCGNSLAFEIPRPASECNFICPGDSSELCGAGSRIVIYEDTDPAPKPSIKQSHGTWSYKACYWEMGVHLLTYRYGLFEVNSVESCTALCQSKGYALAGLQYGSECWCDSYLPYGLQAPEADCNMPCPGDPLQLCGGSMRMQMYVNSGGTPPDLTKCIDWRYQYTWNNMRLRAVRTSGLGSPVPLYYTPTIPKTDPIDWMTLAGCTTDCANLTYNGLLYLYQNILRTSASYQRILPPVVGQAQLFMNQNPPTHAAYNHFCAKPNPSSSEGPFIGTTRIAVDDQTDKWSLCPNVTDSGRPTVVYQPQANNPHYVLSQCEEIWIEMYYVEPY
ncbi:WSC domain-containing protein [Panaeolus papilionaceus]|nr:WSC domain-containing protein [Panaeolus papilionaceus]